MAKSFVWIGGGSCYRKGSGVLRGSGESLTSSPVMTADAV